MMLRVKGLGFRAVSMVSLNMGTVPQKPCFDPGTQHRRSCEEGRCALFNVAATRAIKRQFLTGLGKTSHSTKPDV